MLQHYYIRALSSHCHYRSNSKSYHAPFYRQIFSSPILIHYIHQVVAGTHHLCLPLLVLLPPSLPVLLGDSFGTYKPLSTAPKICRVLRIASRRSFSSTLRPSVTASSCRALRYSFGSGGGAGCGIVGEWFGVVLVIVGGGEVRGVEAEARMEYLLREEEGLGSGLVLLLTSTLFGNSAQNAVLSVIASTFSSSNLSETRSALTSVPAAAVAAVTISTDVDFSASWTTNSSSTDGTFAAGVVGVGRTLQSAFAAGYELLNRRFRCHVCCHHSRSHSRYFVVAVGPAPRLALRAFACSPYLKRPRSQMKPDWPDCDYSVARLAG